ncbi:hypothetical protein K2173_026061 [Erythroxylum novogranatense]|uniref:CUE domain-containing protein n=1 Tax=Erythroxylum novogranatense TaxID=1862640 RepID=A0AAV8SIP5_9ROSI|nr:hypothetical protein K2173_026061 [Erythroxylum novogranatense]
MKPGASTLNPYAASYIPLSKREAADIVEVPGLPVKSSEGGSQTVWCGPVEHNTQTKQQDRASETFAIKGHSFLISGGSSSQNPNEMTEELEMDLEYLQMIFPGISDESLNDAYLASRGDVEATMDMLHQLGFDALESPENLPDTLDIGDLGECEHPAECSSVKLKNVTGEATDSSSSSNSDSVAVL